MILALVIFVAAFGLGASSSFNSALSAAGAARANGILPEGVSYTNPVIHVGSADPHVLKASDGRYYMYNTFGFAVYSSENLVDWRYEGSVMPVGSWGVRDFWAPEVVEFDGRFYLFYSAERPEGGKRIGVAVGEGPTGPFHDLGRPLFDPGFPVIDAHVFMDDDGRAYLYFAQDQVPQGAGRFESRLYGVELAPDLLSVVGEPVELTRPEQPWELRSGGRAWNEAPFVIKRHGVYYLMYSANCFCGADYSVGYATSDHPLGPYTKYRANPVLSRGAWLDRLSGPGHHSVVESPDGRELWIIYHVHADPAAGGGDRRIAIDRMGVREDGSLYVSGPTLTPQPLPSGATEYVNLAPYATLTASSVQAGRSVAALVDGEVAVDPAKERWEWAADGERAGAWFRLAWNKEQRARWVLLYPSVSMARNAVSVSVRTSAGTEIRGIQLPGEPGAAAFVELPDDVGFDWLEVSIDRMRGDGNAGMAEVMVLGSPAGLAGEERGSIWLSSPRRGARLVDVTPVILQAHYVEVEEVALLLDGVELYRGAELPELSLDPAALDPGTHWLTAVVLDQDGREYRYTGEFSLEHVRIAAPEDGARLAGEAVIELEAGIPQEQIARLSVRWVPIGETAKVTGIHEAHAGNGFVRSLIINTLDLPDGAYDLEVEATTAPGRVSKLSRRFVVDNWEVLEDPILPPVESTWFGNIPQIKAVSMSGGWEYRTAEAVAYWGDADRIGLSARREGGEEYLTWRLPGLSAFTVRVYAVDEGELDAVSIWVSADGDSWVNVGFEINVVHDLKKATGSNWPETTSEADSEASGEAAVAAGGGWVGRDAELAGRSEAAHRVQLFELQGTLAPELQAGLLKVVVKPLEGDSHGLEIGHVTLRAPRRS